MNFTSKIITAFTALFLFSGTVKAEDSNEFGQLRKLVFSMYTAYYCTLEFNPLVDPDKIRATLSKGYLKPHMGEFKLAFGNQSLLRIHMQKLTFDAILAMDQLSTSIKPTTKRLYFELCKTVPTEAKGYNVDLSMWHYSHR